MRMTFLAAWLLLFPAGIVAQQGVFVPTSDARVMKFRFLKWGALGEGGVTGDVVPQGQVWLVQAAGIATDDGRFLEWMMQIKVNNPNGKGGYWLVPLHRQSGTSAGTPTLAIDRSVILMPEEALCARVSGLAADRKIALVYSGFSFNEGMLPYLLGIPAP
jgi:hypothetical protein